VPTVNAANFNQPPVQRVSKPDVHGYFPAGGVPVPAVAADPPEEGRLVRIGNMLQVKLKKRKSGEFYTSTVGSRYPEFRTTRPQIQCFVNQTNIYPESRGLIIRKIKDCPVFSG